MSLVRPTPPFADKGDKSLPTARNFSRLAKLTVAD